MTNRQKAALVKQAGTQPGGGGLAPKISISKSDKAYNYYFGSQATRPGEE